MSESITLITGTRKGIGKALAHHFIAQGHVVIGCSRQPSDWDLAGYHHFIADVTREADVRAIFAFVGQEFGGLTNLINNAGIAHMNHAMLTPISAMRSVLETNLIGSFLFCQEAARLMKRKKFGRIVNFTTVAVPLKLEGEAIYASSKAAVEMLTKILAKELSPMGITVNAIGPTPIETDLIRNVPKTKIDHLIEQQPLKRLGTFEDVANVVDFFTSPQSDFITGQTLYLGGL